MFTFQQNREGSSAKQANLSHTRKTKAHKTEYDTKTRLLDLVCSVKLSLVKSPTSPSSPINFMFGTGS